MAAPIKERVTLIVGGGRFEDFTSVWVQKTYGDAFDQFRFTCAEREGASGGKVTQASQQFEPGDDCTVLLAGELAITGEILTRQVSFDANNHGVQLSGVTKTWAGTTSSIEHKTSEFDQKNFKEIAEEVLKKTGIKIKEAEGTNPDKKPFEFMQCFPGETIWDFLERLARERKIILTCTKTGELLMVGENRSSSSQGQLKEGENILRMQCVISNQNQYSKYITRGQINAKEDDNIVMEKAARQESKPVDGKLKKYRARIIPIEQGVLEKEELDKRNETESMWSEATQVQATITVQGWQPGGPQSGGALWEPGKDVQVTSKMAMLDDKMSIQQVTFTQTNEQGSLSTLVCVAPWALNGSTKYHTKG